jgi:hypothetical protein
MPVDAQARRAQAPVRLRPLTGFGFGLLDLDALIDFGAMYVDLLRRFNTEAHAASVDGENPHGNVVTNGNQLAHNATEYKHGIHPSGLPALEDARRVAGLQCNGSKTVLPYSPGGFALTDVSDKPVE